MSKEILVCFLNLRMKKQWNDWYDKPTAQARSQYLNKIFDIDYTPGSVDNRSVFDLKKLFMYAVFIKTPLTDKGKPLVRQYE